MSSGALKTAYEGLSAAEVAFYNAITSHYPDGSIVTWHHGDHTRSGEVVGSDDKDRLLVRSHASGKEVWVLAWNVMRYDGIV